MSALQNRLEAAKTSNRRLGAGVALGVVSPQYGRSQAEIQRVLNEKRAWRLLEKKDECIYDQSFDQPDAGSTILAPMPGVAYWISAMGWLPASQYSCGASPERDAPVLDAEQEVHLFRKMNYLKYRAGRLREALDPAHARESELDEIERLRGEALTVKNLIIRAYLRLVVSIAKTRSGPNTSLFELVSEGTMGLIHAVEKFDFSRGFRFSTYATKAIVRRLARSIPQEKRRHYRFVTGHEKILKAVAEHRVDAYACESDPRLSWKAVQDALGRLDARERYVLVSRYGLEGATVRTLAQLGAELGITRERVRQIESRARAKLRKFVLEAFSESTPAEGRL